MRRKRLPFQGHVCACMKHVLAPGARHGACMIAVRQEGLNTQAAARVKGKVACCGGRENEELFHI